MGEAGVGGGRANKVCVGSEGEVTWDETMPAAPALFTWSVDLAEAFTLALEMILMILSSLVLPFSSMS